MKSLLEPIETPNEARPSRARWDLYVLGQLPQAEQRELESLLQRCEVSQQLVEEIREEQRLFLEMMPPPAVFMAQLEEKAAENPTWVERLQHWWKNPAILAPLMACAAFVLVWGMGNHKTVNTPIANVNNHPGVIVKGAPEFNVYRFRQSVRSLTRSGDSFKKGDVLGFTYRASGQRYLFMVLQDHKGELSWLYPKDGQHSIPLASQGKLTDSVELDGALGTEKLYAFFSQKPLSRTQVKQLLKQEPKSGFLPQQSSIYVHRFLLHKR